VIIASTHGRTDDGRRQWWDRKKSLSPLFSRRNLSAQTFKTLAGAVNQVRLPRKSLFQVFFFGHNSTFCRARKKTSTNRMQSQSDDNRRPVIRTRNLQTAVCM
jgi:hypothetical protein